MTEDFSNKRLHARLTHYVWSYAQQHRPGTHVIARACRKFLGWYQNHDFNMARNGEQAVIDALADVRPRVMFDVGANVGEWSAYAQQRLAKSSKIHTFEIAPPLLEPLEARLKACPNVRVNALGLSDREGEQPIDFYEAGNHSGTTMMVEQRLHQQHPARRLMARVTTGDAYCTAREIERIDFLKIDVEGGERCVLDGFAEMFDAGAIGAVQFEYNSINIGTRQLLKDFYEFFESRGFIVGKIWPRGVSFGAYDFRDEDFIGPNYLAVHNSEDVLRQRLDYMPVYKGH